MIKLSLFAQKQVIVLLHTGRCGAKGRFFKEKAPQKPFWEKVFWVTHGRSANMAVPVPEGRAQYLPKAKTVSGERFFGCAHLSLSKIISECLESPSNWDLSVRGFRSPCRATKALPWNRELLKKFNQNFL